METISAVPSEKLDSEEISDFDPESLISEQVAADFLGVTRSALQKWRITGSGPKFVRISSRCVRYRRRELVEWAQALLKASTSE